MKKSIIFIFLLLLSFILVGCNKTSKETEEVINQENTYEDESSDIKLYSSDDRLVYNADDIYYIVIDFKEDNYASSFKWIYDYGDVTTAKTMETIIKANFEDDSEVKSVSQDGKYIVVDYNESAYENMDRTTIETVFNMYEEVINN